ncbi:MAG TPA: DUF1328 domain-containing protein [Usitatibacter sp.]|nr:DUF1328 domain-containing protein [Usitatibacter sp.]
MLYNAAIFFVITLVAALLGFGGVLPEATAVAKAISVVCLVLFFVSLARGLTTAEA